VAWLFESDWVGAGAGCSCEDCVSLVPGGEVDCSGAAGGLVDPGVPGGGVVGGVGGGVGLYARVSSHDQKADLER